MPSTGDPSLVVLWGPTGSGKTALAIRLAQALGGEIVSADSRQVYRRMDIGTAKPTPAERAAAPHHLIDVIDPDQPFSLAEYQRAANATIRAIQDRRRLPLLVGGTGQYITAVVEGWGIPEVPPNPGRRADLEAFAAAHGPDALHRRLAEVDPAAASRIDARNVRRVVRALEVYAETGTPITELQRRAPPPWRVLHLGLTLPRDVLYARIDARVDQMIPAGLLAEVRDLLDAGYTWECPAMSGLGYVQWRPFLEGRASLDEVIAAIKHATHAYARRQTTWFKGHDAGTRWFDLTQAEPEAVVRHGRDWLSGEEGER